VVPVTGETPNPHEADTVLFGPEHRAAVEADDLRPTIRRPPAKAAPPPETPPPATPSPLTPSLTPSVTPPTMTPSPAPPSLHTDDTARLDAPPTSIRKDHLYIGLAVAFVIILAFVRLFVR
jgi:hypothetical protein